MISQEELAEIKKIPGKILGNPILNKFKFVRAKFGREGIERVEQRLKELNIDLNMKDLKDFEWHPQWLDVLVLKIITQEFNLKEEDLEEMGSFSARVSFIARLMMRYFVSIERVAKEASRYWRKYRTEGELRPIKVSEKDREVILKLEGFKGHPLYCPYFRGYFKQISSYVVPDSNPTVKEVDCPFTTGSEDHLFKITW